MLNCSISATWPSPISCLGRICNVYTWVIGKRNANTVPSKFMLHNIEKPTWSLPRDLPFTVSFLCSAWNLNSQHISFIWYAGEGGPGHEEGRPSALLNIGHQSQTWLWYFFKLWYFETFDTFKLLVKGQSGQTMKNSPLPTLKGLPVKTERKHWLRKGLYFILNYFFLGNRVGNGNNSKPGNITDSLARSLITIV